MDADTLYPLLTAAVLQAEDLQTPEALAIVSFLEEKVAEVLPANLPEGVVARAGAIRAARSAGDHLRAWELANRYGMAVEGLLLGNQKETINGAPNRDTVALIFRLMRELWPDGVLFDPKTCLAVRLAAVVNVYRGDFILYRNAAALRAMKADDDALRVVLGATKVVLVGDSRAAYLNDLAEGLRMLHFAREARTDPITTHRQASLAV